MWTTRDFLQLIAVAAASCALTTTALWPRSATAQEKPVVRVAEKPAFKIGTCSITADAVKTDQVLEIKETLAIVQPDSIPTATITIVNQGDVAQDLKFTGTATIFSAKDMFSRGAKVIPPAWTYEFVINIGARETKALDVKPGVAVPAGGCVYLTLVDGKNKVNVLTFMTPPVKPKLPVAAATTMPTQSQAAAK